MIISKKAKRIGISSLSIAAILVIASLASIGMMQTNNAAAAGYTVFESQIRGKFVEANEIIQEGSITTQASAFTSMTSSGDILTCVTLTKYDASTDTYSTQFFACDTAGQLTVANDLNSAISSGTVTGTDFATGEEKTVTANVDLTATGKVQTGPFRLSEVTPEHKLYERGNAVYREASGSLNISGDLTYSTDDATGLIAKETRGLVVLQKV